MTLTFTSRLANEICPDCWHRLTTHDADGCRFTATGFKCRCKRTFNQFTLEELVNMGIMDQINQSTRPSGGGADFMTSEEKQGLVETGQPFQVTRLRRGTLPGTKFPDKVQWFVDVEFLTPEGGVYEIEDEEGNSVPIRRCITFGATEQRDAQFPKLQEFVQANGQAGPLKMVKYPVKGQPNPAYAFEDWTPFGTAVQPEEVAAGQRLANAAATTPPPPSRVLSPDGKWEWDGSAWIVAAEHIPPPPPTDPEPPAVIPATLPFSGAEAGKTGSAEALPKPGVSQPLPPTRVVQGGDGEGNMIAVEQVEGDKMRQVVYRGDGVIQTPSGGLIQAGAPETKEPKPVPVAPVLDPTGRFMLVDGNWVSLPQEGSLESRRIAQEAADSLPGLTTQEQAPEPVAAASEEEDEPAKPRKKTYPMRARCEYCGKTAQGNAFQRGNKDWIITHSCDSVDSSTGKRRGGVAIIVNDEVNALMGAS